METQLNENMRIFMNLPIEAITTDNVKKYFPNNLKNDFGGLLHAAVQEKFNGEKVLKFVKVVLESGYDVNYRARRTGYSFIHLALYGYTSDGEDYSYSTEFIVRLIRIAKDYSFNVNIKDNDGDSLIHTAIASEVYTGRIIPILEALGNEFDNDCVDDNHRNILSAYRLYLDEAKNTNTAWFNRLRSEYSELKNRLGKLAPNEQTPTFSYNKESVNLKSHSEIFSSSSQSSINLHDERLERDIKEVTEQISRILRDITYEELINKKNDILILKNKLNSYEKELAKMNPDVNENSRFDKFQLIISKIAVAKIKSLENTSDIKYLEMQKEALKELDVEGIDNIIDSIILNYRKKIEKIGDKIKNELTLANVDIIASKLDVVAAKDKEELEKILKRVQNQINQTIKKLNRLSSILNIDSETYDNFTLKELKKMEAELHANVIDLQRQKIISAIDTLLGAQKEVLALCDGELFTLTELQSLIDDGYKKLNDNNKYDTVLDSDYKISTDDIKDEEHGNVLSKKKEQKTW